MAKSVTNDELQALLKGDKPVLVDFHAAWCGPCKSMAPAIEALSEELGDKVEVVKVDVDQEMDASMQFKVRGIPTLVLMRRGVEVARKSGAMPAPALKSWVAGVVA